MKPPISVHARDQELVRRYVQTRRDEAFRELYRTHSPYLFALALRLSGGRQEEAEEALQEAWIRIAQKLPDFRWQSALRTWLAGFLVNTCREQQRRRLPPNSALTLAETSAVPPVALDGRLDLDRQLAALPEHQRSVLVLYAIEGYTHEEIGSLLGIASGTSKSRLFEARRGMLRLRTPGHNSGGPS